MYAELGSKQKMLARLTAVQCRGGLETLDQFTEQNIKGAPVVGSVSGDATPDLKRL